MTDIREDEGFRAEDFEDITCYFCQKQIVLTSFDDFFALAQADYACWMAGFITNFDDLGEGEGVMSVCPVCAARQVGPEWRAMGRAVIALNEVWHAVVGTRLAWRGPLH